METKFCNRCKITKPIDQFWVRSLKSKKYPGKIHSACISCEDGASKAWRKLHPERHSQHSIKWNKKNPKRSRENTDRWHGQNWGWWLKKDGITMSRKQYDDLKIKQSGCCAICGIHEDKLKERKGPQKTLYVDHNHLTKKIRGLLCNRCNSLLGFAGEDIRILLEAIEYLKKHTEIVYNNNEGLPALSEVRS